MSCLRRHMCWQSKRFYWERAPGESSRVREPRRTALPHGLPHGLGITVMGLVSWLSLANHSDSESFLVVNALFSQDGCQRGFWEVVGQVVSPFDLSRTLLVGGGLLVPCSLPGPPVVKQLMQMVAVVPGQGGRFHSVCFPNTRDSQESSPTPQFKSINSSALSFLHSPTLTSIHDHWKNHSLD